VEDRTSGIRGKQCNGNWNVVNVGVCEHAVTMPAVLYHLTVGM